MNTPSLHTEHRLCHLAFQQMSESFQPGPERPEEQESMVQISSLGCDGRVHLEQRMGNMRQRYERAPGPVRDACGRCCGQVEQMTQVMDRNLVSHCQGTMERMGSFAVEECGVEPVNCHEHWEGSTFCVNVYDERPQRLESSYCSLDRGLAAETALPVPDILPDTPTVTYAPPCCVPIAGGCQFQYPPSCFCANVGPHCFPRQPQTPVPNKQVTESMTRLEQLIKQLVLLIPQLLKQQQRPSPSPSPSTKKKEDVDRKWKKMEQQQKKLETQLEEQKADYEKKLEDQKKKHEEESKDKSSQEKEKKDEEKKREETKKSEEQKATTEKKSAAESTATETKAGVDTTAWEQKLNAQKLKYERQINTLRDEHQEKLLANNKQAIADFNAQKLKIENDARKEAKEDMAKLYKQRKTLVEQLTPYLELQANYNKHLATLKAARSTLNKQLKALREAIAKEAALQKILKGDAALEKAFKQALENVDLQTWTKTTKSHPLFQTIVKGHPNIQKAVKAVTDSLGSIQKILEELRKLIPDDAAMKKHRAAVQELQKQIEAISKQLSPSGSGSWMDYVPSSIRNQLPAMPSLGDAQKWMKGFSWPF